MFNRVFWSIIFIFLGLSLLASNFNIPILKDFWKLWPATFIYIGFRLILFPKIRSRRRKKMKEERYKILRFVEEGKIGAEEAEELIKKLEETQEKERRYLRINVIENNQPIVNINVPLSLIKWGLKFANIYSEKYGKKIEISPEEIEKVIDNPDFKGKIVDINNSEENIRVIIEII